MMYAYIYRSGHVLIGRAIPAGVIGIAAHENESELTMVCRWFFPLVEDAEGCPTMAYPPAVRADTLPEEVSLVLIEKLREEISKALRNLARHPAGPIFYHIGSIEHWSADAIAKMQEPAA